MKTLTKEMQENITPEVAIEILKKGNKRFINNLKVNRDFLMQINETSDGQHPFAVILSCIDSRTSSELIFDQGLGDIFSIRIAGNIINKDILGSMEFSCKLAGAKLIVVLGHSKCGAIKGACSGVEMENLSGLLEKIKPSIEMEKKRLHGNIGSPGNFEENVSKLNVEYAIQTILAQSKTLSQMASNIEIAVVGGIYNVETGVVQFFDHLPDSKIIEYYKAQAGI